MELLTATTWSLADVAHDMHLGSQALITAHEAGIITDQEYDQAEVAFDTCQNKVYAQVELG